MQKGIETNLSPCGCGPEVPKGSLLGDLGTLVVDMCKTIKEELVWILKIASDPERRKADKILTLIGSQMEENRRIFDNDSLFNCHTIALRQRRASEKNRLFHEISAMNGGNREVAVDKIRRTMKEKMEHFGITEKTMIPFRAEVAFELKNLKQP